MPSWNDLLGEFASLPTDFHRVNWLQEKQVEALSAIGRLRNDRHVITYISAFLQRQDAPSLHLSISSEDINGIMSVIYGMDWTRGLVLVLHTPGGVINATETLV